MSASDKKIDIDVYDELIYFFFYWKCRGKYFFKIDFRSKNLSLVYIYCLIKDTLSDTIPIIIDTEFHRVSPSSYTFTYIPPLYSCYLYPVKYRIYLENHVHSKTYITDQKFQIVLHF